MFKKLHTIKNKSIFRTEIGKYKKKIKVVIGPFKKCVNGLELMVDVKNRVVIIHEKIKAIETALELDYVKVPYMNGLRNLSQSDSINVLPHIEYFLECCQHVSDTLNEK